MPINDLSIFATSAMLSKFIQRTLTVKRLADNLIVRTVSHSEYIRPGKNIAFLWSILQNQKQLFNVVQNNLHKHNQHSTYRIVAIEPTISDSYGDVENNSPGTHISTSLINIGNDFEFIPGTTIDMTYESENMHQNNDALVEGKLYKGQNFTAKAIFRDYKLSPFVMFKDTNSCDRVKYYAFMKYNDDIAKEKQKVANFIGNWEQQYKLYDRLKANCCHPVSELVLGKNAKEGITPQELFCDIVLKIIPQAEAKYALEEIGATMTPYERGEAKVNPQLVRRR